MIKYLIFFTKNTILHPYTLSSPPLPISQSYIIHLSAAHASPDTPHKFTSRIYMTLMNKPSNRSVRCKTSLDIRFCHFMNYDSIEYSSLFSLQQFQSQVKAL